MDRVEFLGKIFHTSAVNLSSGSAIETQVAIVSNQDKTTKKTPKKSEYVGFIFFSSHVLHVFFPFQLMVIHK